MSSLEMGYPWSAPVEDLESRLDRSKACESLGYALDRWTARLELTGDHSYRFLGHGENPRHEGAAVVTEYEYEMRKELQRKGVLHGPYSNAVTESHRDERPYFTNPVPLNFDPELACRKNDGKEHEGIEFWNVWRDPLARTLWMAAKQQFLTSQYFRQACVTHAEWIRLNPPIVADNLHVSLDSSRIGTMPFWFRIQLWPYVVRVLMDEQNWPYLTPPGIPDKPLQWTHPGRKLEIPHCRKDEDQESGEGENE